MLLATQLLLEGKITSEEYVKEIISGYVYLEAQEKLAQSEKEATLAARVEAGTLSSQVAIDAMIFMFEQLAAQNYDGMQDLMASTRSCIAQATQAKANAVRDDVEVQATIDACYEQRKSQLELQYPGRSRLFFERIMDNVIQDFFAKGRDTGGPNASMQAKATTMAMSTPASSVTTKRKRT